MFGAPLFLIAAAIGALIPLILHLLQKKRVVTQVFPTLRFLKMADKRSSSRIRLENLLLWLMRTAIMVLLGLGFAMPVLRTRGLDFLGKAQRDIAIVLDVSYSMNYLSARQTAWEKALDTAGTIIKGLESNDKICIYLAGDIPSPLIAEPIGDHERATARLNGLKPRFESCSMADALTSANNALTQAPQRREREIFILTDNQALPWRDFDEQSTGAESIPGDEGDSEAEAPPAPRSTRKWDPASLDSRTAVFVAMLGVPSPVNVAAGRIELAPPFMFVGSSSRLTARVEHSGSISDTAATLFINGREIARRPIQTESEHSASFVIPPQPPGMHRARIETPEDNLHEDNVFHFLINVKDQLPSLIVGSEQDIVFLKAALTAGSDGTEPRHITRDQLSDESSLSSYSCIFLVNALPLPGQAVNALEQYAGGGGLLVIFPGSRAVMDDYRAWAGLPGAPSEIRDYPNSERSRVLIWNKPEHPLLEPMRDSLAIPQLSIQRSLAWDTLAEDAIMLISAGDERPFLLQRNFGRGSILIFSITADRAWSSFPLSPYYLPLMMQIVEYSAKVGAQPPFVWSSDSFALNQALPTFDADSTLLDPESRPVPIRSTIQTGRAITYTAELMAPGVYSVSGSGDAAAQPALAVNFPREESDLTPIEPDRLRDLLKVSNLNVVTDREALEQAIKEHRIGRTYGEYLLLLAAVLIGMEFYYANMLFRNKPNLSSQLGITSSGKLSGHASPAVSAAAGKAET